MELTLLTASTSSSIHLRQEIRPREIVRSQEASTLNLTMEISSVGKFYFLSFFIVLQISILENNLQKMFGEPNGSGGQFAAYENSALLNAKETVISLDYVGTC